MPNTGQLEGLLKLSPLADNPIPFSQFLMELKEHPERADTAHALLFHSVQAMGAEKPEDEPDPERRLFLEMLQNDLGIPSLLAFKHDAGSQMFSNSMMGILAAAGGNGAQLKKMLVVSGGPGSGKDYWKDGLTTALEEYGKVYAVKGCKEHENPLNLLKLLTREQLEKLAEATGLNKALFDMLAMANDPCQSCYNKVMGDLLSPKKDPSLSEVQVEAIRISRRTAGISEWKPGQSCSLTQSLRKGNRGYISMPDVFLKRELKPGETDERLALLDAVQYRNLPGTSSCEGVSAASPLDTFMLLTTNPGAMDEFLNGLPDKNAFTTRTINVKKPYNLVRVEEIRAYNLERAKYKKQAELDPLVLKMLATVAVVSRYNEPVQGEPFVHPIDQMRLLQGERIEVKPREPSEWTKIWGLPGSSSSDSGSSRFGSGSYSSGSGSRMSSSESTSESSSKLEAGKQVSAGALWKMPGKQNGLSGFDMRLMLSVVSSINEYGLRRNEDGCVSSLEALALLRMSIVNALNNSKDLTEEQQKVYQRCLKWLGGKPSNSGDTMLLGGLSSDIDKPELFESEYRRLLKSQILRAFAPDYEERAQELYDTYKLHASATEATVKHPKLGKIPVKTDILDELDKYRVGKTYLNEDDLRFRNTIEANLAVQRDEFVMINGPEAAKKFKESWRTIPELAEAIRIKLDKEIGKLVEKLLITEVVADLTEDEQEKLAKAKETLTQLGYCKHSQKPVLEYAKRVKIWSFKG